MKSKLFFNSVVFQVAGIISVLRNEELTILISFLFAALFLVLSLVLKRGPETVVAGQFE